jgi:1,4-dihydroxy-2-naphthoate octaprenyltransferase
MKRRKESKQQKVATFKLWALPASAMPVVVTFAYLFWKGADINWLYAAGALLVILLWAYLVGEGLSKLRKCKLRSIGYILGMAAISIGPAIAAAYAATGELNWTVLWAAGPISLISAGILRAKNARDVQAPTKCTSLMYTIEVALPLIFVGVCSIIGIFPMHTIVLFMTTPVVVALSRTMKRGVKEGAGPIVDLDTRTVNFLLTFSTLTIVALVLAKYIFN